MTLEEQMYKALDAVYPTMKLNHPATALVFEALTAYKANQLKRTKLKVVPIGTVNPLESAVQRINDAINIQGLNQAQRIAVLHLLLSQVTKEVQQQMEQL